MYCYIVLLFLFFFFLCCLMVVGVVPAPFNWQTLAGSRFCLPEARIRQNDWNWRRFGHWTTPTHLTATRQPGHWQQGQPGQPGQLAADSCRNIAQVKATRQRLPSKTNQTNDCRVEREREIHVTLQFIWAMQRNEFINSRAAWASQPASQQQQKKKSNCHPHGRLGVNSSQVLQAVTVCVWVCVCVSVFIHSKRFTFRIRLRAAKFSFFLGVNLCASRFLIFEND